MQRVKGSYRIHSRLLEKDLFICSKTDDIFGSYEYHYSHLLHGFSVYPTLLNHVQKYGVGDLILIPEPEIEKAVVNVAKETRGKKKVEKALGIL
jgi:hypothetical protein